MANRLPVPINVPLMATNGYLSTQWTTYFNSINLEGVAAGGDLSGTYPNPTVAKINNVSLGSTTASTGNLLIANGSAWSSHALSGDATIISSGVLTLANTAITPATYTVNGNNLFTVDSKGRLTSASNITITATPSGTAGGDLSGSYPNPTVASINGVALGTTTATSGNILIGSGTSWVTHAVSGDGTLSSTGSLTVTKTNGTSFAASATTDTTNAANISSGTLPAARLPNPTASTLGGIESYAAVSHQWINTISTSGVPSSTQPAASDLSNGTTGSGSVVLTTSPSLVTPTLGVASATSINFGGSTLDTYTDSTFTPTITCNSPGNLSVTYGNQSGTYVRIGKMVFINCRVTFTPTFTTASGTLQIAGLPFTCVGTGGIGWGGSITFIGLTHSPTWPTGTTSIASYVDDGASACTINCFGSAVNNAFIQMSGIGTGLQYTICFSVAYHV